MKEIERKFLVKELPNINNSIPVKYERYFLSLDEKDEIRIQKKGDQYEFEEKKKISDLEFEKTTKEISEEEFNELKDNSVASIKKTRYFISINPQISIKIYSEDFEGFIRVEVEFNSVEEANAFQKPEWFGREITGTNLEKDSKLVQLKPEEFRELLTKFS